jgi:hypothetical protein
VRCGLGNCAASKVTKSVGNPLIPIFIYTKIHITTLQTNNHSWFPLYTEPKLFVTQELEFLTTVFKENGYSSQQIWWVLKTVTWAAKTNERPTSIAFIPYTQTTSGRLSRMLAKHNNKSVSLPPMRMYSYVPPVRNALGLRTLGVYSIPHECGQVYIGQSS